MAITQTDIDNLQQALVSGELRVSFQGRTVEYRSIAEIQTALAAAQSEVAAAAGTARVRDLRMYTRKGF